MSDEDKAKLKDSFESNGRYQPGEAVILEDGVTLTRQRRVAYVDMSHQLIRQMLHLPDDLNIVGFFETWEHGYRDLRVVIEGDDLPAVEDGAAIQSMDMTISRWAAFLPASILGWACKRPGKLDIVLSDSKGFEKRWEADE